MMVVEADLERYVQYDDSDCLNGAVVKVSDGRTLMNALYSHHYCLMTGQYPAEIALLANVFGLEIECY
jgi:hypothetical protein